MYPINRFEKYIISKKFIHGKIYILLKKDLPLKILINFKKTNDYFIQHEGYAPILNIDDFDIPETDEPEDRDSDSGC